MKVAIVVIVLAISTYSLADVSHLTGPSRMYLPPKTNQQSQFDQSSVQEHDLNPRHQQSSSLLNQVNFNQEYQQTGGALQLQGPTSRNLLNPNQQNSDSKYQLNSGTLNQQKPDSRYQPNPDTLGSQNSDEGPQVGLDVRYQAEQKSRTQLIHRQDDLTSQIQNVQNPRLPPGLNTQYNLGQNSPALQDSNCQQQLDPNSPNQQNLKLSCGQNSLQGSQGLLRNQLAQNSPSQQDPNCQQQQDPNSRTQQNSLLLCGRNSLRGTQGIIRNQQIDPLQRDYLPPNESKDVAPSHTLKEDGYHYKVPESNQLRF